MLKEEINIARLDERISKLEISGKIVIAFDFDELVVPMHLTSEIVTKLSKPVDEKMMSNLKNKSYEKIGYLNSLLEGNKYSEYKRTIKKEAKDSEWSDGFKDLLIKLMKEYSIVFISSGLRDVCEAKLSEIRFNPRNIIAGELEVKKDIIVGSRIIVSDESKGYVVKSLKSKYKIIAIGHSIGDKKMLDNSDVGISYKSRIPDLAQFNVNNVVEIYKLIEKSAAL